MFEWINSSIKNYIISVVDEEFFASNSDDDKLKIQKLSDNAIIPIKGTKHAAGYDLYSIETIIIPPLSRVLVNIGLSITTPEGTYGRIAPRSGMALNGIDVGGGVIDQDYTGPLKVILINSNDEEFRVVEGMKIAQLVCEKIYYPEIKIVEKLESTERGSNGFGSTDVPKTTDIILKQTEKSSFKDAERLVRTTQQKPKNIEEMKNDFLKSKIENSKNIEELMEECMKNDLLKSKIENPKEIKKEI